MITLRSAFATAMRMVHWIFCDTACRRAKTQPTYSTSLAPGNIFLVGVTDLTDRGSTISQNVAQLARGQLEQRVGAFLGHQLSAQTGAAHQLTAFADLKLDIMHDGADRE